MKTNQLLLGLCVLPMLSFPVTRISIASGNWSSPFTWSPLGVPSSSDKIRIYHDVTLNQDFTASDTIFVYNTLNIKNSKALTLNPGTMILVNNATYKGQIGTVGNNGEIIGNFTFQKWVSRCDGNSTYGTPFNASPNSLDWYYCNQCQPSWSNMYYYNESTPGVQDSGYVNTGNTLQRGRGFFYWYSNYAGGQNFPRQISMKGSINFDSDFNFNVSYTSTNGGYWNDGFNLLSNPYPGTIDWGSNSWSRSNVGSVIYTWNTCTNSYAAYVGGISVNGGSRYIPSMQGFWVQSYGNNPGLTVDAGAMVSSSQSLLRTSNADSVTHVLKLSLGDDEIAIHLDSTCSNDYDPATDALKFFTPSSRLCSSTNLWSGYDYAINSVKDCDQIIPIKVKGGGVLNVSGLSSFNNEYDITIRDLITNEIIPVTENMTYTFTDTTQVSFQKRFQLHLVKNKVVSVGIQQNQLGSVQILKKEEQILISNPDLTDTNVRMYDLQGRLLYSGSFVQQLSIQDPNTPVLIWLYNDKGSYTKKMF